MGGGAQQRYPRLSGVDTSLQRRPLVGGGEGGAGSSWLGGILGPPFYDHTVPGGGEASIGPTSIDQSYDVIRGILVARSTLAAATDTTHIKFSGDVTDAHYDFAYINLSGNGFPDNWRNWAVIPGAHATTTDIWAIVEFRMMLYSTAIKHALMSDIIAGPKGTPDMAVLTTRQHVAAAVTDLEFATDGGLWAQDTRMICWFE